MDQVSHLLSHPLSSWISTDSYSLDQDIIASREALHNTAKAIGSDNSLRSTSRRAENMSRQQYQHQDQTMHVSASRPELYQSAFISAAGISSAGSSPYNASYMAGGHYTGASTTLGDFQQQQEQLQNTYYTAAPTYNTLTTTAATTQAQEPCYLQLPSINSMYDGLQYPAANYGYDFQQLQQQHQGYYTDENELMYGSESRPFFDYQGYNNYMDSYPPPPLMDADQTAFSTPDVFPSQRFPEPKTPPPPATAAARGFDPVAAQEGDDLVGLGLYDEPMSSSLMEDSMSALGGSYHARDTTRMGKGLTLEETFDPEERDDDEEEEEEEEEEKETKQA